MPKIDPHASWAPLHAKAAAEQDPRRKALLQAVGDHMEAEICGRLEPLMATLTEEPVYHFWGNNVMLLEGYAAVEEFYRNMIAAGGKRIRTVGGADGDSHRGLADAELTGAMDGGNLDDRPLGARLTDDLGDLGFDDTAVRFVLEV